MNLRLAIAAGLLGASLAMPHAALACGQGTPEKTGARAPRDVPVSIYWVSWNPHSVAINVSGLDGRQVQVASREFEGGPRSFETLAMSADRQQVLFLEQDDTADRQQLVVFDARRPSLRSVLALPQWSLTTSDFAPDGSKIAIYANYDSRDDKREQTGLYLLDTISGQVKFLGTPGADDDGKPGFGVPYWSRSGNTLFLEVADNSFRVDLDSGKFVPAKSWDAADTHRYGVSDRPDFELAGQRVAVQEETRPQSITFSKDERSLDGSRAYIDSELVLWVERAGKRQRVFALPHESPPASEAKLRRAVLACGDEFGIQGWIGNRILLYQLNSVSYGYDVDRNTRFVFAKGYGSDAFWW